MSEQLFAARDDFLGRRRITLSVSEGTGLRPNRPLAYAQGYPLGPNAIIAFAACRIVGQDGILRPIVNRPAANVAYRTTFSSGSPAASRSIFAAMSRNRSATTRSVQPELCGVRIT